MLSLDDHVRAFRRDGFTVFPGAHSAERLAEWRAAYDAICAREGEAVWLGNTFEIDPALFLPAVANPDILDFAEAVMGPFVQLDALAINAFPPVPAATAIGKVNGWHRDRYAIVPETSDYVRPISINTIFYFQDMDDALGPLRVVPGSHRQGFAIDTPGRTVPRADEVLIYPRAGDVVVTHYLLVHSGTPNTSGQLRYFMSASYNSSWMKHRDRLDGPKTTALRDQARAARDRRLTRLLGEDDLVWDRTNPYWSTGGEAERWAAWIAEDRAWRDGVAIPANPHVHPRATTRMVGVAA
ncbi:phytanoyl-CoA dioxygenase family protein [Glacieibacterium frigidum]|uniref:Phytanoyl-CoA dioxygenase family protein n=1 Tax=Glacieibacterium frigidum TaxID=2593303 RepID=A0A552U8M9_9SPHN|nr:phytanoyl-CoA dioxygenase family protein [Glacieibacterium frigidum]TRW14572.1 phytanoyl-CoA dioxygenase family protein [Glacieibacterium frigidum]